MFLFIFSDFRHFKLYLMTNTGLFTDNVKAVFVDKRGRETSYDIQLQNYFTGHVVGKWMTYGARVILYTAVPLLSVLCAEQIKR